MDQKPPSASFRITPRKGRAFFNTCLALLFLLFANSGLGDVHENGRLVTGAERDHALLMFRLFFDPILAWMLIWYGRKLLPGCPYDYLRIDATGLAAGGLFGEQRRTWPEISSFGVGWIPLLNNDFAGGVVAWITAKPAEFPLGRSVTRARSRPMRFFMGGYVRFGIFSRSKGRMRDVAEWLDQVRLAYLSADVLAVLPKPPSSFCGEIEEDLPARPIPAERVPAVQR